MNGTSQTYKAENAPKFFAAYTDASTLTYSYLPIGTQVQTGQQYLMIYDTEEELASVVDTLKGESGWYMKDENRIPYPPNPNEWEPQPEEPEFEDPFSGDTI